MSCNYAEGLSPYAHKGKLGLTEVFDDLEKVKAKVKTLAGYVRESGHTVVHTGAGISTSAGIPDFRGPKGVWTLEKKGLKPNVSISWDDAKPTKTHRALRELVAKDKLQFVVTQNIDGLHMRSGIPRRNLAEVHGNMFVDQCGVCRRQFCRSEATMTVGQKVSTVGCPGKRQNGRQCRGKMADFVLDWEDNLPDDDLDLSDAHSCLASLSIVMGSTLQIIPAGNLPLFAKKYHPKEGKLVIINLQPTKHDKKADLVIHDYVDRVMELLFEELGLEIPEYDPADDPTKRAKEECIEWTQSAEEAKRMKKEADEVDTEFKRRKKELLGLKKKQKREEEQPEVKVPKMEEQSDTVKENSTDQIKENFKPEVVKDCKEEETTEALKEESSS